MTSKKMMHWEANSGDGKATIADAHDKLGKEGIKESNQEAIQKEIDDAIVLQTIPQLKSSGTIIHNKEELAKYLKNHGYDDITQFINNGRKIALQLTFAKGVKNIWLYYGIIFCNNFTSQY